MAFIGIATPTYNEKDNIEVLINLIQIEVEKFPQHQFIILVIDDNSPDKTGDVVESKILDFKSSNTKLEILHRKEKEGLGKAYINGFEVLIDKGVEYIIQMDADLSHNPKYLPEFINAVDTYQLVVGSRYIKGGGLDKTWPLHRKILSTFGNIFAKTVLNVKMNDLTGGYNLYSVELLKKIKYKDIYSTGYGFLIELKYKAYLASDKFKEVPIIFKEREKGYSKIPTNTIIKNFILCFKLRLKKNE